MSATSNEVVAPTTPHSELGDGLASLQFKIAYITGQGQRSEPTRITSEFGSDFDKNKAFVIINKRIKKPVEVNAISDGFIGLFV